MNLVPIKVKILRAIKEGQMLNKYPNFNQIPAADRGGLDWSYFIDQFGGVKYDKKCGFGEVDIEDLTDPHNNTDPASQFCTFLVPQAFAIAALNLFPNEVTELTEIDWTSFHDGRATIHMPEEIIAEGVISGITAKKGVGRSMSAADTAALDPEDDTPGIVRNKNKRWADVKIKRGITIVAST